MVLAEIPLSLRLLYTVRAMIKIAGTLFPDQKGTVQTPGILPLHPI
jgi:hypothetical protein